MKSSFLLLSGTVGLQACDATVIATGTPYYMRNVANLFPGSSIIPSCSGNARRVRTDAAKTPFSSWPQPRMMNSRGIKITTAVAGQIYIVKQDAAARNVAMRLIHKNGNCV